MTAVLLALAALMTQSASHAQFDHLVVGIRSLDEGMATFERLTHVKPVPGGKHPDRGTENALVSLGDGMYLEIIAPQKDARLSPGDESMRDLKELTIIGWAVRVDDLDRLRKTVAGTGVTLGPMRPGSRVTPSGTKLEWSTVGIASPQIDIAPFFIRWSPSTTHPSQTAPSGCSQLTVGGFDPQGESLARVLKALGVQQVSITGRPPEAAGPHAPASDLTAQIVCGERILTLHSNPPR